MPKHRSLSKHMQKATHQLEQAKGRKSTTESLEREAISLASLMLLEANRTQTSSEKKQQKQLSRMMGDSKGKAFTTCMTDQCFRSHKPSRVADQLSHLLCLFGIPKYLHFWKRCQLSAFQIFAPFTAPILIPFVTFMLRKETSSVILPGESSALSKHMKLRRKQGVRINLNHLGEAILGENEAKRRLQVYIDDLGRPDVEYVSIKISTIYSQIHLIAWEETLEVLAERLRMLYRASMKSFFVKEDGTKTQKFVNLDMEEYKDLHLTKQLFQKVLNEPEFFNLSAGIVLQAYLPDCFPIQKELTEWAIERVKNGGSPIKIRIVKGANLALEQVEASLRIWPQAPYTSKDLVDSNYKRMVTYGCMKENAQAVHLGIGSHNLFDIAYAMLLRAENHVEKEVNFEMLEGMADHIRRVVQTLSKDILLYCPVATKEDFQSAIAYLIRRLDENTGPDNFLRYTFGLIPGTNDWEDQVLKFSKSCSDMDKAPVGPRRTQNRFDKAPLLPITAPFENDADTDFSLEANRKWAYEIKKNWEHAKIDPVPCMINSNIINHESPEGVGVSPSNPGETLYTYTQATWEEVNRAIETAKKEESSWQNVPVNTKAEMFAKAAQKLRERRSDLTGVMMLDGGKSILECDTEISEAIDFIEYYLRGMLEMNSSDDVKWSAKGTILVTSPWNFPVSIPTGGIFAALAAGNCVLFKPASESVLSGWVLANALWDAGISKDVLQFIACKNDPVGSQLIIDQRINSVILTGATSTAELFMKMRPDLDLHAETGGKNALIITAMADRDLAIKDLVQSAFGHSGQKCSAASLGILEAEVYNDPHFMAQLKDAVESLCVGSPWNLKAKVTPLIRAADKKLFKAFTTLEKGEKWLVEPKQDPSNPNLWSPGVKLGVKPGSYTHVTELFGPVLSLMKANNLDHAIEIANSTRYGLTSGISSLDEREQKKWLKKIVAGNLYLNRGITGAIVKRQAFGGCKASCFGYGSKAGGPNYIYHLAKPTQVKLPDQMIPPAEEVNNLVTLLQKNVISTEELGIWYASISNYTYWARRLPSHYNPDKPEGLSDRVLGQDNGLYYVPHTRIALRLQEGDSPLDIFRILAASLLCHVHLEVSFSLKNCPITITKEWQHLLSKFKFVEESEDSFLERVSKGVFERVRLASTPNSNLRKAAAESSCFLNHDPVLASGRFELLHYFREVAVSADYHRYGNLGMREGEVRNPIL
jgi:RHH-type transcriptional regulator, proline utilization regulon repressor / proline dehydrogenase / delta 1-pyrroline-5-carboxylate dehydrogenase